MNGANPLQMEFGGLQRRWRCVARLHGYLTLAVEGEEMVLAKCPECRRPTSTKAEACPRCGGKLSDSWKREVERQYAQLEVIAAIVCASLVICIFLFLGWQAYKNLDYHTPARRQAPERAPPSEDHPQPLQQTRAIPPVTETGEDSTTDKPQQELATDEESHKPKDRRWTDPTGKHETYATLVAAGEQTITLRKPDGSVVEVPLDHLSTQDQQFVKKVRGYDEVIRGTVVGVMDGVTLSIRDESATVHEIRLQGIGCPDRTQPFGLEARKALSTKVFRQEVRVETQGKDESGRTLGVVYVGSRNINLEMAEDSWAWQDGNAISGSQRGDNVRMTGSTATPSSPSAIESAGRSMTDARKKVLYEEIKSALYDPNSQEIDENVVMRQTAARLGISESEAEAIWLEGTQLGWFKD